MSRAGPIVAAAAPITLLVILMLLLQVVPLYVLSIYAAAALVQRLYSAAIGVSFPLTLHLIVQVYRSRILEQIKVAFVYSLHVRHFLSLASFRLY